ncbi:MAG: 23S rRNA (adenine(2503)-C(2))-methyltransferase RlmN [Pseudomonadota bacterium]
MDIAPTNLFDLDRAGMEDFFLAMGEKKFRAQQMVKWIHQQGETDFDVMTNLSKVLRQWLRDNAVLAAPQPQMEQVSKDGTRKWLLPAGDNNSIETVFIPEDDRNTLCISSQVGCILDCRFCATAQQGFNRNLSTGEIISQVWLAEHSLRKVFQSSHERYISNVVLMGMGEPLANFKNVVRAMRIMLDDFAYGLSWRRITLSTAGMVPMLDRLKAECPVNLAVSLHAPVNELRDELVPLNRRYPVQELIAACLRYLEGGQARRRITFEYVMLDQINDSPAEAHALVKLLGNVPSKINLIPFNPFPGISYKKSKPEVIEKFQKILIGGGLITTVRKTRGDDIDAACGQLAGKVQDRTHRLIRQDI